MAELTFNDRVDDAILVAAFRLAKLRQLPLRGGLKDFRQTCVENADFENDNIWGLRVDRCNALLFREDDELRHLAMVALERER
jgi:hypothetical protein